MRVAADNYGNPGSRRVKVQFMQVMEHVKRRSAQFDKLGRWQRCARPTAIDVPAYGSERSDFPESVENLRVADVSRVKDVVDCGERLQRLRP